MNVAILDYGAGNLTSLKAAFSAIGANPVVTRDASPLRNVDRLVIPGVGHFSATAQLRKSGMEIEIRNRWERGVPLLGICLGMQWLFDRSAEAPGIPGLAALEGSCERFPAGVKTPHVGWNQLERVSTTSRLLRGIPDTSYAYFTHSYRIAVTGHTVATSDYAGGFSAAVEQGSIYGVQFHPEKSAAVGLKILENFCASTC